MPISNPPSYSLGCWDFYKYVSEICNAFVGVLIGEYWLRDIQDLERHVKESGGGPPSSDAYILNGRPGPLHNCSRDDVYTVSVTKGKKYLLRIINAALNMEHFFGVANHTMTVVETDGEYTKPFNTSF